MKRQKCNSLRLSSRKKRWGRPPQAVVVFLLLGACTETGPREALEAEPTVPPDWDVPAALWKPPERPRKVTFSAAPGSGCPDQEVSAVRPPRGVNISLGVTSHRVSLHEGIGLELRLRHGGSETFSYFTGEPGYELWVEGPTGVVWVWTHWLGSKAQGFPDLERRQVVEPGQILLGEATWEQKDCRDADVPPAAGRYSAQGYWFASRTRNHPVIGWLSDPVEFEIR